MAAPRWDGRALPNVDPGRFRGGPACGRMFSARHGGAAQGQGAAVMDITRPDVVVGDEPIGEPAIEAASTGVAAIVAYAPHGPVNEAVRVTSVGDVARHFGAPGADSPLATAVEQFLVNGGHVVWAVRVAHGTSPGDATPPDADDVRGDRAERTGLYALEEVEHFDLLSVPGSSDPATPGSDDPAVLAEAVAYCAERRAFLVVDPPAHVTDVARAIAWITNLADRHPNAAAYWPRPLVADPAGQGMARSVPASPMIAGLYARTDARRGVWKAPAGTEATLTGVAGLTYALTDAESGLLNPLGLNALRTLPVHGTVAWGARTLVGGDAAASEWRYVPVRRLALHIEESLRRGTRWVVFEPNAEPLWAAVRRSVAAFMDDLFRRGALQGRTPPQAYAVRCGADTMTRTDIEEGRVIIEVAFAPLKPAEFVIIRITQRAAGRDEPEG